MPKVSFANDIMPVLKQYNSQMIWRFDLTSYEDVKKNADYIKQRINSKSAGDRMPPPPFPALDSSFIALFNRWVKKGCPP